MWGRGTMLGDRYTLVERIGGGAMGDVWRADDGVLERQVAIKILLPSLVDERFTKRFRREAKILAALSHPGIVDVHDYGESDLGPGTRVAYIVMELVDGRPLNEVLAERGPMPAGQALDIAAQALDALHAAHLSEVVHRDIKPSNLMLRADGRVTVTDFGIARAMADTRLTASHAVLGTALYVAPEQAEGTTTPASDLYSIGVVCYELLTGELPFTGETPLEFVLKQVREPAPELPAAFPQPVRDFVAKALAKRPEDRFGSAAAMAAVARRVSGAAPGEGGVVPATIPAARPAAHDGARGATPDTAERRPRRTRRQLLMPLIIPCVITAGAGTVLLIDPSPFKSEAATGGSHPTSSVSVSVSAPASASGGSGAGTSAPGSASPSDAASAPAPGATAPGGAPGGGGNQAANPPQGTGGGSNGGSGGAGAGGGAGNPPPGGNPTPVSHPTPTPTRPAGCGGNGWGDIVNVGDHLKIGLASDSPADGTAVVMGGHTEFGWVDSTPDSWHRFNACNLSDPQLGSAYYGPSNTLKLVGGSGGVVQWTVVSAGTSGASYIKDYQGQTCLTDNGAGQHLSMTTCTPGNTTQEWWLP